MRFTTKQFDVHKENNKTAVHLKFRSVRVAHYDPGLVRGHDNATRGRLRTRHLIKFVFDQLSIKMENLRERTVTSNIRERTVTSNVRERTVTSNLRQMCHLVKHNMEDDEIPFKEDPKI